MAGLLDTKQPSIYLSAILRRQPREPFKELGKPAKPHPERVPYAALRRNVIIFRLPKRA